MFIIHCSFYSLSVISCGNSNPNLSEKQLQKLMDDPVQNVAIVSSDTNYVPPAGTKYTEIRSIDPVKPPANIEIVANLENKKAFKLSDIASSVKYIYLEQPPDNKFSSISNFLSDEGHIFVNAMQGLFCYSAEGKYLYTLCTNEFEESSLGTLKVSGLINNADLLNGRLIFRTRHNSMDEGITDVMLNVYDVKELDSQMLFSAQSGELKNNEPLPKYQRRLDPTKDTGLLSQYLLMDDLSFFISNSLTGVSISGDTLCKFNDYPQPETFNRVGIRPVIYRIDGSVMLRNNFNDTIFRVVPPNRLLPTYVLQWGKYKPDINQHAAGSDLDGKLVLRDWIETARYIFMEYTEGRAYPTRWMQGKVNFHWAIFDKTAKTLTHHITSTIPTMREVKMGTMMTSVPLPPLLENDIEPVGMPFWPSGLNHNDEMYMIFSKELIKSYIATGQFNKLQAIHDNMPDDSFCLMIVK